MWSGRVRGGRMEEWRGESKVGLKVFEWFNGA